MKRYRVVWKELHDVEIDAEDQNQALEKAYETDPESTRTKCEVEYIEESEPEYEKGE